MRFLVAPLLTSPKRGGTEGLDDLAFFCKLEAGKYKIAVIKLLPLQGRRGWVKVKFTK